ncbi:MAG: hypothetical protein GX946_04415 [Oligosphaeraceae bacterium]|nr:hypothetical protein [Oligosphaeraceae bacterium]
MKYIECSGSPYEMGCCYGETAREEIQFMVECNRHWYDAEHLATWQKLAVSVMACHVPELLEELRGMAAASSVSLEMLLAINFVDTFDNATNRCTPLLLHDSPQGPIVAKNNDAGEKEQCIFVTLKRCPSKGIPTLGVTYAGWLSGLDVMNEEGLANTHGSVGSKYDKSGLRLDIRLAMMQGMTQCRTTRELLDFLQRIPLTGKGFSIALGDKSGETCFLDAAVPRLVTHSHNVDFSFSTNLYRAAEVANMDQRTEAVRALATRRSAYIEKLQHKPEDLEQIQGLLRDHSSPWAPCRHGGESVSVTRWSMICLPQAGQVFVADGFPCQTPYLKYAI